MSHRRRLIFLFAALTLTLLLGYGSTYAATSVFVNEFHYDNSGGDTDEAIEIAGPAGTDLAGWSLVLYNGNGGAVYNTITLSGVIPDQQSGFGTLSFTATGLQNGSPDGFALVDAGNNVAQFLSYEGSFTAVGGPADGMTSTDVGVSEPGTTPVGSSLQLTGTGSTAEEFTWTGPTTSSFDAVNSGQTFVGGTPSDPEVLLTEIVVTPTDGEFVEIYNPTDSAIDLSDFYLTDATFAGGSAYYYNIVTGANAGGGGFGDFHARFPDGAMINPSEYQTIALAGSDGYFATYGVNPTYELFEDGASADGVADMREALPGSISNQGGLSNSGEVVILYEWDGLSDLVTDMDYAVWGDKAEAVDKTGISIDGPDTDTDTSSYLNDTPIASQDVLAIASHAFGNSWQRDSLTEGAEITTGGNGVNGEDETSEDLSNTWCENPPTPGAANDCAPPPTSDLVINELLADPAADLAGDANGDGTRDGSEDEFLEIVNSGAADLDISGWVINDAVGLRHTFPADTIIPANCSVIVFGGGAPTGGFGGSVVQTASTGFLGLNNAGDTITVNDGLNDVTAYTYGGEGGNDQSLTRDPDITGPEPLVQHGAAAGSGGALFSPGTMIDGSAFSGCGGPTIHKIHEIQGSGLASPLVGDVVMIEGVVVGDFQEVGEFGGFHVQEEDGDVDGDPATSEGVFVYHYSTPVAVGDVVRVTGTVAEYNDLTELTSVSEVTVLSSGASVTAATISLPVANTDDLEAYEGMSVIFPQALNISEYFNFDRYGEIVFTVDRPFQPTAVYEPGSPEAAALADENARSRITLDDGRSGQNPDPARHPNGATFDLTNRFRGGDQVQNLTGVLDYSFGKYKIQPTAGADYIPQNPRTTPHDDVGGNLKVASFNVLNYFTTLGSRGADDAEEFDRQRTKIFAALADIDADVVGLIEIENNGPVAISDLVGGLNDLVGAGTYAYIDTGIVGDDEITVAFIYKPATVTAVGAHAVLDTPDFTDPNNLGQAKNRPALAQTFALDETGGMFTAVVNHLKSKGSSCGAGDDDPEQGNCNLTRTLAAQVLMDWIATDPTGSNDPDFLVMGDLNAYDKEDPIDAIVAAGYADLLQQFLGEFAYSYVFSGQFGYLDHALANQELLSQISGVTVWHINSDEPDILDYDTTYKQDAQDALYEPNAYRSSDHDPVIIGLLLKGESNAVLYISSNSSGSSGGVDYKDEDILAYDVAAGDWTLYFDGSDMGLRGTDVDAIHVMDDGSILMSFSQRYKIPGFGKVDDSDIVKFIPTSLGEDTDGSFEMFFNGSDVGLKKSHEDVDAMGFTPDGRLVVSTNASFKVPQTGGGDLRGGDDDLIVFNGAVGTDTSGDWEMYFKGSDAGLKPEDIWGTWLEAATGDIYISLQNEFTVGGVSGDELDVIICHPDSLGEDTACTFEMYFDGSEAGFGGDRIDGLSIGQ